MVFKNIKEDEVRNFVTLCEHTNRMQHHITIITFEHYGAHHLYGFTWGESRFFDHEDLYGIFAGHEVFLCNSVWS